MAITRSAFDEDYYIECPFEHDPDKSGKLVHDGHEHPKGFVHDYYTCEGVVNLEDLIVWMAQTVATSYQNPGRQNV